jgi:hypothetical protein
MNKNKRLVIVSLVSSIALMSGSTPSLAASVAPSLSSYMTKDWTEAQWHLTDSRIADAWNISKGEGEVVAVIDTGVDANHPDLKGNILNGFEFVSNKDDKGQVTWSPVPVDAANMTDEEGHGTHVSGIIAAKDNGFGVTGVASSAKILPIKINNLMHYGTGPEFFFGIKDAIHLAVDNHAKVINMSLGGPSFEGTDTTVISDDAKAYIAAAKVMCDAISWAKTQGTITVVAAGNDGIGGNPSSLPAICKDAVSVAATDVTNHAAFFSSYDPTVNIAAPGYNVLSTLSQKVSPMFKYGVMSGTSMASPVVAGAVALLQTAFPEETPDQIIARMDSTAVDAGVTGKDSVYGYGLLDLGAAIGADEVRNSVSDSTQLVSSVRYSYNDDPNSFTVAWNQPLGSALPDSYTVKIYDRYGSLYSTDNITGENVRYNVELPDRFNYAFWAVVSANYGNKAVTAPPVFQQGNAIPLKNVSFNPVKNDTGALTGVDLSWSGLSSLETDAVAYGYYGLGMFWDRKFLVPDTNGDLPTSVHADFTQPRMLVENTDISDYDVQLFAYSATSNGLDGSVQTSYYTVPAKNAIALGRTFQEYDSKKISNNFVINNSHMADCEGAATDCSKAQFKVTYKVAYKDKKKKVKVKTYTKTIKSTDSVYMDFMTSAHTRGFKTVTPFNVDSRTVKVNVTVNLINANGKLGNVLMPTKTIYANSTLNELDLGIYY